MKVILDFFVNNYIWFLVISLILIFALIGYFVDTKNDERFSQKIELDKELEAKLADAKTNKVTINQMINNSSLNDKEQNNVENPKTSQNNPDMEDDK